MQPNPHQSSWYRIWVPRITVTALVVAATLGVAWWFFNGVQAFLYLVIFTVFLAFALEPMVRLLERRGLKRGLASGLVLLAAGVAFVGMAWLFVRLVVDQVRTIAEQLPEWITGAVTWLNDRFGFAIDIDQQVAGMLDLLENFDAWIGDAANILGTLGTGLATGFTSAFAIVFLLYYAMADGERLRRAILTPFPPDQQRVALLVWNTAIEKTGGYVYSRILLATFSAVAHAVAFLIIGLDSPIALGAFVGLVSQIIPNVGTFIGGALPVLAALVQEPVLALWVLGVLTVYQQVENYLLVPRITQRTMELHPAVSFGAVIIGASLMGFTGLLLALPVVATIQALVDAFGHRYDLIEEAVEDTDPSETSPPED